jgi:hypothetical protein
MDASNFNGSTPFYDINFEAVLSKITVCYQMMIADKIELDNDENKIRDILLNEYINNPNIKRKIKLEYFVFSEITETNTSGRTDIRIQPPNSFYNQQEYYIIECKRLDIKATKGISGLNAAYINDGIYRFTSRKYSSYYRVNAMVGFVVQKMDIHQNTKCIDTLLKVNKKIKTTFEITRCTFIPNFDYQYKSEHLDTNHEKLRLYHLMFDFSNSVH